MRHLVIYSLFCWLACTAALVQAEPRLNAGDRYQVSMVFPQTVRDDKVTHLIVKPQPDALTAGALSLPKHCLASGEARLANGRVQVAFDRLFCINEGFQQLYDIQGQARDNVGEAGVPTDCISACEKTTIDANTRFILEITEGAEQQIIRTQPN